MTNSLIIIGGLILIYLIIRSFRRNKIHSISSHMTMLTDQQKQEIERFKQPFYFKTNTPEMERVKAWMYDICNELNGKYANSIENPEYFIKSKIKHPYELRNVIMVNSTKYHYLDNLGLVNRGYCPITGEFLNSTNTVNFTLFGRTLYMSEIGALTCQQIQNEFNRHDPPNIITTHDKSQLDQFINLDI